MLTNITGLLVVAKDATSLWRLSTQFKVGWSCLP